ncbi:MAG TPA: hypothetical protein VHV79_14065 [Mycobacteriales bacterium]|nr:hypothetical protein [Mycobacteriales bacterium]
MIAIPRLRSTAHGCVVAAVHSDCRHLDRIVARAIERAAIDDQPTIFLTVITERPLSTELTRIRMQLRRYPVPIHLVASWIDGADLRRTERQPEVAAAPVHGAAELGAASLVMGLHPLADVVGSNLASRVATLLPP